jgi:hypothetical protein
MWRPSTASLRVSNSSQAQVIVPSYPGNTRSDITEGCGSPMTEISIDVDPERCGPYKPVAVYYLDSDCVEYVKEDAFCIYQRIDSFLTLIVDETKHNLIGFKLKGFKYIFEQHVKPLFKLNDSQFIDLVSVIEAVFTQIGDEVFSSDDDERQRAYKAAIKLASSDNVKLSGIYLKSAA